MILKRLRTETQVLHSALEARIPVMDPAFSLAGYRRLLTRFYGFYVPLETRLVAWSRAEGRGLDYAERVKVPALERDLIALGETAETVAQLPRCAALPALATEAQGLGCLYVVEGSTLGGQVITRQLQKSLGLSSESGVAFFNGYGAETGARWKTFGFRLEEAAARLDQDDALIAGANETFRTLERWLMAN
jgi:heme oxygenase